MRKGIDVLVLFALLFIILMSAGIAFQPDIEWNRTYGDSYSDGAWSIQNTDDGGYVATGYTSSNGQASDLWIFKTNCTGHMQWNKVFGGSQEDIGYFIKQTPDKGFILTGSTKSYGLGEERLWLLKTDSYGTKEWDHTFGGFVTSSGDGGWSVDSTDDGGFVVTGYTQSYGAGKKDLWLIKTDHLGAIKWSKTFGGPGDDVGMFVIQTNDGGYLVAGRTASFGSGADDVWMLKVDYNGREQWNRTFGGQKDDVAFQVIELDDGYALTGRTESLDAGQKAFLLKTNLYGKKLWERYYGKDSSGLSLQQTHDRGFIIVGSMNSQVTGKDAMLVKTDPYGHEEWIRSLGGSGEDLGTSVVESPDEGYVMTGITNSFGAGSEDAWMVKVVPENVTTPKENSNQNKILGNTTFNRISWNNQ